MINVKTIKRPKKSAASSAGGGASSSFSRSTSDKVSYAENAAHADNADYSEKAGSANYAEKAGSANYATEAGVAQDLAAGSDVYNRFLRKDIPDAAAGKITFNGGTQNNDNADFGVFAPGWVAGTGARIDDDGNAEFNNIKVRGSMTASELIFNLIDAEEGESIRSIAHGVIDTVTMDTATTGTATLRLDGEEYPTVGLGDICRGMYNILSREEYEADPNEEDINGFRNQSGFFSSYFTITSFIKRRKGECSFTFTIQSTDDNEFNFPPCEGMKFVAYGNVSSTDRQSCMYISAVGQAPKVLYLTGVNQYAIQPENIKIAIGYIEGVQAWEEVTQSEYDDVQDASSKRTWSETVGTDTIVHYAILKTLHGNAGFYCEDNIYLGGILNQFKSAALDAISSEISNLGQAWVFSNISSVVIDCDSDGYTLAAATINIQASLYFGNQQCALNYNQCWIDGFASQSHPDNVIANTAYKTFTVAQGTLLNSQTITIRLEGTYNGNTYLSTKTVTIIASRQGDPGANGDEGRGIVGVSTYYKAFPTMSSVEVPEDPTVSQWAEGYIEPTEENPFLWRFTRTYYTDSTYDSTDAEFVGMWSDVANLNLLDDTDFIDNDHLAAWYSKGTINPDYSGTVTRDTYSTTNTYNSVMGRNQFHVQIKTGAGNNDETWYQLLCQRLITSSGIQRVEPGKWYTMSFWVLYYRTTATSGHDPKITIHLDDICDSQDTAYKDGAQVTGSIHDFALPSVTTAGQAQWNKHTVTFKTKSTLEGNLSLRIETKTMSDLQHFYICMPKLEIGKMATRYISKAVVSNPFPRTSNWEINKQYYQGAQGEPYLDIVRYNGQWNRCRVTHVSDENNAPVADTITAFWEPSTDLSFISTDLILANTALIENLIARSLRTGESGSRIPHVEMDGNTVAFYGALDTPSIVLTTGAGGVGVLRFYNADGSLAYDLGPNSITQQYHDVDSIFRETYFKPISGDDYVGAVINYDGENVTGITNNQCAKYYWFIEGYVAVGNNPNSPIEYNVSGGSSPSSYDKKYLKFGTYAATDTNIKNNRATVIEDGWYVKANSVFSSGNNNNMVATNLHMVANGKIVRSVLIYIKKGAQEPRSYYDADGNSHRYLSEVMNSTIPDLDRE